MEVRSAPPIVRGLLDPNPDPSVIAGYAQWTAPQVLDLDVEALRGIETGRVLADAEPKLWALATVLPIVQDNLVAAAGPRVDGASLNGSIQVGIFGDAGQWRKIQ